MFIYFEISFFQKVYNVHQLVDAQKFDVAQSAKILLVHPKCELIMVLFK